MGLGSAQRSWGRLNGAGAGSIGDFIDSMALAQGLTDHALEGAKALSGVKSVNEAAELQAKFAKAALEKVVAEGTKLQEASVKLAESAFAPVNARFTVAMEKLAKPLAA